MQMEVITPKSVILSSDDAGVGIILSSDVQENSTVTLKDIASASGFPNVSFNIGCNITVSNCCAKENVMESFVFTAFMKENLVLFLILFCVLMLVVMRCVTCCMSKSRVKNKRAFTPPKVCNLSFSHFKDNFEITLCRTFFSGKVCEIPCKNDGFEIQFQIVNRKGPFDSRHFAQLLVEISLNSKSLKMFPGLR